MKWYNRIVFSQKLILIAGKKRDEKRMATASNAPLDILEHVLYTELNIKPVSHKILPLHSLANSLQSYLQMLIRVYQVNFGPVSTLNTVMHME